MIANLSSYLNVIQKAFRKLGFGNQNLKTSVWRKPKIQYTTKIEGKNNHCTVNLDKKWSAIPFLQHAPTMFFLINKNLHLHLSDNTMQQTYIEGIRKKRTDMNGSCNLYHNIYKI